MSSPTRNLRSVSIASSDIGYSLTIFLSLIIGNISLFFFSSPSTLPKIFYLVPHSCIIRGLYYQIKSCVEKNCITSFQDISQEHWVDLVLPYFHFIIYFALGLYYYEPKISERLVRILKYKTGTKRLEEDLDLHPADASMMSQANPEGSFAEGSKTQWDESVERHVQKISQLPVLQNEYSFVCKEVLKKYVQPLF
jgi:hypothetical protein